MPAPPSPPPPGGDQDRGPSLIGMFWTECALAMIIVGFRFYARISMRNLGADDWMMLLTVVCPFRLLAATIFPTRRADPPQVPLPGHDLLRHIPCEHRRRSSRPLLE